MPKISALFAESPKIASELSCRVWIQPASTTNDNGKEMAARAIWDTGATHSSINPHLASSLGLVSIDTIRVDTAGGETKDCDVYLIDLRLPNGILIADVAVAGLDIGKDDFLIGMDVISRGDFAVSNFAGKTCYTFRVPSAGRINFMEEAGGQK